jgi:uncharacterized protein DUF6899
MPYLTQDDRLKFNRLLIELGEQLQTSGELNYCIARLTMEFLKKIRGPQVTYHDLSRIHGVLQDVANEYYRKVMAPYEDNKEKENGEVFYY